MYYDEPGRTYGENMDQSYCEGAEQLHQEGPISSKICWVFGKDKVIDFRNTLFYAKKEDYASIHGTGGKGHAPNSTIMCMLCDYTAGKGDKSVTVSYRLDVEDVDILVEAAKKAYFGDLLNNSAPINRTEIGSALDRMRNWLNNIQPFPDNTYPIAYDEIVQIGMCLSSALNVDTAAKWTYSNEKNNPYARDEQTNRVPVQKIQINYSPFMQDGSESRNPWYIGIENFEAPITVTSTGASFHRSKDAVNRKNAFIVLSKADFLRSMIAVKRFITNWEQLYHNTMMEAMRQAEYERTRPSI